MPQLSRNGLIENIKRLRIELHRLRELPQGMQPQSDDLVSYDYETLTKINDRLLEVVWNLIDGSQEGDL
jgi:hypothetical protein